LATFFEILDFREKCVRPLPWKERPGALQNGFFCFCLVGDPPDEILMYIKTDRFNLFTECLRSVEHSNEIDYDPHETPSSRTA